MNSACLWSVIYRSVGCSNHHVSDVSGLFFHCRRNAKVVFTVKSSQQKALIACVFPAVFGVVPLPLALEKIMTVIFTHAMDLE